MFDALSLGALNHLLAQADWARARLAPFAGRAARVDMPPWRLDFVVREDGHVEASTDSPDVTMTLPADAPLRALQGMERVIAGASVEGNAHFATELSFVFRHLRWDAEEDLSRVVGDIVAHRIVQGTTAFATWQKQAWSNAAENLAEYLTEENPLVARKQDLATFRDEVAALCEHLSRLENRCAKLARPAP